MDPQVHSSQRHDRLRRLSQSAPAFVRSVFLAGLFDAAASLLTSQSLITPSCACTIVRLLFARFARARSRAMPRSWHQISSPPCN
eukprot:6202109-Pleurochrysis_carterae.AAC.1